MTMSRRLRIGLSAGIVVTTAVATLMGFTTPKVQAFFIQNHETITRNALPANQVSNSAMLQILVGPPPGAGAVGSDAFATDEWRHLDNSITPVDICNRAKTAWDTFSPVLLSGSAMAGSGLANGPAAPAALGGLPPAPNAFY